MQLFQAVSADGLPIIRSVTTAKIRPVTLLIAVGGFYERGQRPHKQRKKYILATEEPAPTPLHLSNYLKNL
jgi:hypothetical protein